MKIPPRCAVAPLLLLLLAACGDLPTRDEYPRAEILASEDAARFVSAERVDYYAGMDGTVFEPTVVPEEEIIPTLESGHGADVVIVTHRETLDALAERGLIDPLPWQFLVRRDRVAVISHPDAPLGIDKLADLLDDRVTPIAMEDPQSASGGILMNALKANGVWEALNSRLDRRETAIEVLRAVRRGEAPVGFVPVHKLEEWGGDWNVEFTFDAIPDQSPTYFGAVVAASPRPVEARRLWNHMERVMHENALMRTVILDDPGQ